MTIYFLCGSDGVPRYVGQTQGDPKVRLRQHVRDAQNRDTPKALWIRARVAAGNLRIEAIRVVPLDEANAAEIHEIAIREATLLNIKAGGQGYNAGSLILTGRTISRRMRKPLTNELEIFKELGWSQKEIAKRFGICEQTISRWNTGIGKPPGTLAAIAKLVTFAREKQIDMTEVGLPDFSKTRRLH